MLISFLKVIKYVEIESPISHGQNYQVGLRHNIILNQAVQSEQKTKPKTKLSHLQRYERDIASQL